MVSYVNDIDLTKQLNDPCCKYTDIVIKELIDINPNFSSWILYDNTPLNPNLDLHSKQEIDAYVDWLKAKITSKMNVINDAMIRYPTTILPIYKLIKDLLSPIQFYVNNNLTLLKSNNKDEQNENYRYCKMLIKKFNLEIQFFEYNKKRIVTQSIPLQDNPKKYTFKYILK